MADTAPGWSAWPAPAKLNLFLRVTGRRADGYHVLQTVFRMLDWGDTVRLRVEVSAHDVHHAPAGVDHDDAVQIPTKP